MAASGTASTSGACADRGVERLDPKFEAAAALLVRDKRKLVQRPCDLVQVIADAIEFDQGLRQRRGVGRYRPAVHARARRRFDR